MKPAKIVYRDPDLAHQIVLGTRWALGRIWLYVSCNCRRIAGEVYEPLDVRELYEPGDALEVWRAHMKEIAA